MSDPSEPPYGAPANTHKGRNRYGPAIITAVGAILAALIGGMFLLLANYGDLRQANATPTPTATATNVLVTNQSTPAAVIDSTSPVCPPATDTGPQVTGAAAYSFKSLGGPTVIDITVHHPGSSPEFTITVTVAPAGTSGTVHGVWGIHAWEYASGCTEAQVDGEAAAHISDLRKSNPQVVESDFSNLEAEGVISVD